MRISSDNSCRTGLVCSFFRCPHCAILIFRDENRNITNHERKHTCPECSHTFGEMSDEAPTEFRRMCRNLGQKTEGVMLQIESLMERQGITIHRRSVQRDLEKLSDIFPLTRLFRSR